MIMRMKTRPADNVVRHQNGIALLRSSAIPVFLALVLMLASCSSNHVVYRSADSSAISSISKIAVLPVLLDAKPADADLCMGPCYPARDRSEIGLAVTEYLEDELHYDIVCLDPACVPNTGFAFDAHETTELVTRIADWRDSHPGDSRLSPRLAEDIGSIGEELNIDAVAVVHGRAEYVSDAAVVHWIATLTFSSYYSLFRGNAAELQAEIYSVHDGALLWSSAATVTQIGTAQTSQMAPAFERYGIALFEDFEENR